MAGKSCSAEEKGDAEESSAEGDNQRQGEIHRETVTIAGRDSRASK